MSWQATGSTVQISKKEVGRVGGKDETNEADWEEEKEAEQTQLHRTPSTDNGKDTRLHPTPDDGMPQV